MLAHMGAMALRGAINPITPRSGRFWLGLRLPVVDSSLEGGRAPRPWTRDRHAESLLRLARRYSYCADDAQDAYQRTLEIYLERLDRVEEATAGAWLRTVCKHEAMRIRAPRQRVLPREEVDFDARPSTDVGTNASSCMDERSGCARLCRFSPADECSSRVDEDDAWELEQSSGPSGARSPRR